MEFRRTIKKALILCLLFSGLSLEPAVGRTEEIADTEHVTVVFDESLRTAAEEVIELYPVLKANLEGTFGWRLEFRPTILLVKNAAEFHRLGGHKLTVAFAVPRRNTIVIDNSKMKTHPFSMEGTLKHELCHLLLNSHMMDNTPPPDGLTKELPNGSAAVSLRSSWPKGNPSFMRRLSGVNT